MELFSNARAWLSAIDPALPAAALVFLVFITVYSVRRWLPGVWKIVEATVPFADSLDPGPVLDAVWKSWQVLPGALLGAAVSALSSGLSVQSALWGVAAGAMASLGHELMAAYKGEVGKPKPPSVPPLAAGLLAICLMLGGCWLKGSFWPKLESCAPSPAALVSVVETIFLSGDNIEADLQQAGLQYGKAAIECAAQAFADSIGPNDAQHATAKARARDFVARVKASQ